jgi:putative transposase
VCCTIFSGKGRNTNETAHHVGARTGPALPGIPQHVIQRGNNREPCFCDETDYCRYLDDLKEALQNNGCALHAYALMTNHVHLLLTPSSDNAISHTMQDLGRSYVQYINRTYKRSGTLWEGRYKASLVDSEAYLLICMRYIEMNPVRASMVSHPGGYRWTSYSRNAYGKPNTLITPHSLYLTLGDSLEECQHSYRELFGNQLGKHELHTIREALNQELVLGREDFKDKIESMTQRQSRRGKDGRP